MSKYLVKKVLSNNAVFVSEGDKDYILLGKGIGFSKKKGMVLEKLDNIENTFVALTDEDKNLIYNVDKEVLEIVEQIIDMASNELKEDLNPHIHVGLIDHINFAIKRLREGIEIVNPFLVETKLMYPKEYDIASKAVKMLKGKLNIEIPDAEIGFIAFHIHGGRSNASKSAALKNTKLVNMIVEYVEKKLKMDIKTDFLIYNRFVYHLVALLDRVNSGKTVVNNSLETIKKEFFFEYKIAYDISKIIQNELKKEVSQDEVGYIALHIYKLNSL
ncbi:PRD domain-containing protein [Tepidibacter aestuarii]|uniref:PRD domain-containing protein n=1 Tax=Tepidibacter aestuarii TaxID=2925782 RepID=UPI0020BED20D|nr:PRD domain-containing protein [Tepidibacter aestuarii]CAH2212683.1 transcriptional antiterminator [Tepidibacter aestuarii]